MQIPDTEAPTRDLLALINTAHTHTKLVLDTDGKEKLESEIDNEGIFWETQNVSSPYFGLFVQTYKDTEALKEDCYNHMSEPMARVFAGQIERHVKPYRYGVEAKSSETVQDKHNNKPNLVDKIKENKLVRQYNVKDEVKRGMFAGLFGRDKERDMQND